MKSFEAFIDINICLYDFYMHNKIHSREKKETLTEYHQDLNEYVFIGQE